MTMMRGWSLYREKMIAVAGIWGGAIDCTTVVWLHLSKRGISWSCKKYGGAFAMHGVPGPRHVGLVTPHPSKTLSLVRQPSIQPTLLRVQPFQGTPCVQVHTSGTSLADP